MKKSLATLGLGAALLVGLTSCQSTKDGGYAGDFEEATIMSDELPPWLTEGSDDVQIAAGSTTDRNQFAIPEGGESTASATSQNHPEVAANNTDDVIVEDAPATGGADIPAPMPSAPSTPTTVKNDTPAVAVHTPSKPTTKTPKPATKKPTRVAKFDKPTMVVYKVKKGDNLSLIAKRSNTTVDAIRKASGVKGDKIIAGQIIKVPYTPNGYKPTSKVSSGSSSAGKGTGKTGGSAYTVKQGDTISAIAARNGVSTAALLKANGLSAQDATKIRAGRKLTIPGKSSTGSSAKKAPAKKTAPAKKSGSKKKR